MAQQVNIGGSICEEAGPGAAVCRQTSICPAASAMISDGKEPKFNILIKLLID